MNTERQLAKADLADTESKMNELAILADSRLLAIRNHLNPHEDDITKLHIDKAMVEMTELHKNWQELKRLSDKKGKLREALYG
jgi:hypothetical protein